jgi:hypothetical protein
VRLVARAEQEIRAYPRLHSAFYAAVTRNARVRDLAGRAKDRVRDSSRADDLEAVLPPEEPRVAARRVQAVAARLGIDLGPSS